MIQASNISLRFGKKALFEEVNIKFTEGNCYGIIGANGAGKSTFLKILSGELEPTTGEISLGPGERLSVLEQDHFKYDDQIVLDTVIAGNQKLYDIMKEKDAIYAKEDFSEEDGMRASELEAEFATMNGWEAEADAATLLNGLGIATEVHYKQMSELPDTDKVKVLLARALFGNPDILLLDDRAIQRVLRDVENADLELALKNTTEEVQNVIYKNLSKRLAAMIKEDMDFMGPVRMKDVEEAQQKIVAVIRKLEDAGEIVISRGGGDDIVV